MFKEGSSQASALHLAASASSLVTKIEISRAKRSAAGGRESSRVACMRTEEVVFSRSSS